MPSTRRGPSLETGGGGLSIVRALTVLELIADADEGVSLSAIARSLTVNKQIAARILSALVESGYVYRDVSTDKYYLSYKLSNLGLRKLMQTRILDPASSVIRDLASETGELVRLAVVENERITWVLAAVGKQRTLHIDPNYSLEIALHSTATGKAWLSTMPFERALGFMLREGIKPLTKYTKTSIEDIRREIEQARSNGWSLSYEETELGVGAVAAPIIVKELSGEQNCVGTISVAAPTTRMQRGDFEALASHLVAATRRLGEMWPKFTAMRSNAQIPRLAWS
jgi:IclR family transcriptional regulator, acetate operon repressor